MFEEKATGTTDKRPLLQALMASARKREIDIVLCWKLDRFARSLKNLITAIQEFQALGVDFVSLKDNIDLTTPSGRLMVHMLGAFSEFEASLIRERVNAGLREARRKGVQLGRPIEIDSKKVVKLRKEGKSLSLIAKELNCSKAAVFKILKRSA